MALVARTKSDVRDVMVEGESGVLAVSHPGFMPRYEPSKRRISWPNGVMATTYSADEPDQLRGPQHEAAWADEIGTWKYPDTWDQLMFGLRLGQDPRVVVTTTPRPVRLVRALLASPTTVVTRGSTHDNAANLAPPFLADILARYEGTRLGRQEIDAELLEDTPGALWTRARVDSLRVATAPELTRVVVAVDPAATSGEASDETGIVVAGRGVDGHGYVLADFSCRLSPDGWARRAVGALREYSADRVIAETNNGGEMVELTIRTVDRNVPYRAVHASRGKRTRAEPVAALYEQSRVFHVGDPRALADLEDQMVGWSPGAGDDSPDRVDALVWALTDLMLDGAPTAWTEWVMSQAASQQPSAVEAFGAKAR